MVNQMAALDDVFAALADPTRRAIVERLARGEHTAGEIASAFAISQPAVSKHLKVLERCGVLKRTVRGREHRCRLNPRAMHKAGAWIERQQRFWEASFERLDALLAEPPKNGAKR